MQRLATTLAASREKVERALPKGATVSRTLRVTGIFRNRNQDDQSNILTRFLGGSEQVLVQHARLRPVAESLGKSSVGSALVYIDQFDVLDDVDEELRQRNMATISATGTIKRLYDSIDRSEVSILLAASVIFLVAAIGISNTMIISVVERSEEIGILKAVGASNRQVTLLVMFECLMTGFVGGILAVGLTYVVSAAGNSLLRSYVEQRGNLELDGSVFAIEPWMIAMTLLLATAIAALAGLWPARKAARMDPIEAMGRL
jgi:putative ABC transport system permease protein